MVWFTFEDANLNANNNLMTAVPKILPAILIVSILMLINCTEKSTKNNSISNPDTLNNQISKSVDDFMNRPIHKVLTTQIIDTISDNEIIQVVFDNLSEKIPDDYQKEYQTVLGWTKHQQAIYIIWLLEAEVNNGGYNQFYYNSSGLFASLAPDALRLIGAKKYADLTKRANAVFAINKNKITKEQDGTIEGFSKSYDDNPLDKFDDEFYALEELEILRELQVEFIRKNKLQFIDK